MGLPASRRRAAGGPIRLGWDVSGAVAAVGPGVTLFEPGDEVFGMPLQPRPAGTCAEYVVSPARHLTRKPAGSSHVEAAALPLVSLTAWQALVDTARVRPGRRVLVRAAAGGVGHVAVQLARTLGLHVTGTASAAQHDLVRALGETGRATGKTVLTAARVSASRAGCASTGRSAGGSWAR